MTKGVILNFPGAANPGFSSGDGSDSSPPRQTYVVRLSSERLHTDIGKPEIEIEGEVFDESRKVDLIGAIACVDLDKEHEMPSGSLVVIKGAAVTRDSTVFGGDCLALRILADDEAVLEEFFKDLYDSSVTDMYCYLPSGKVLFNCQEVDAPELLNGGRLPRRFITGSDQYLYGVPHIGSF